MRAQAMARPFPSKAERRLLLVTQPNRIPRGQIHPLHHHASDPIRIHGAEVREAELATVIPGQAVFDHTLAG